MTVAELIEMLEDMPQDAEVRIATQPSWPFENDLSDRSYFSEGMGVVYLAEGEQRGYLEGDVKEGLGW